MPERDAALIVIHDDDCGYCRAVARWLQRRDHRGRLQLQPIAAPPWARRQAPLPSAVT